jgi:hypothetical protein
LRPRAPKSVPSTFASHAAAKIGIVPSRNETGVGKSSWIQAVGAIVTEVL